MISRILVAVDGSEPASRAVALGADLAVKYGAPLHLVHVIARLVPGPELLEFARIERVETPLAMEMMGVGQSIVAAARAAAAAKGAGHIRDDVLTGDPADALLGYARDLAVDLIVMGRRGVGPIRGLLMGSVSLKVNSLAECPVLTVR
jgi:nucleotide-binding universal stress UspA family protein